MSTQMTLSRLERDAKPSGVDSDPTECVTPSMEGITVCLACTTAPSEYGGRSVHEGGDLAHLHNTQPGRSGWLGNPHSRRDDSEDERRRVIGLYARDFARKVEVDDEFREHVEDLRGGFVGCWCRSSKQRPVPSDQGANWCHLDVVDAWLRGDMTPVHEYVQGDRAGWTR